MIPEVWIHSMVSLDGRITGFEADLSLYYGTAMSQGYDAALVGSGTILAIKDEIPPEEDIDRKKKADNPEAPYLVLVDSGGKVRIHHLFRKQDYIREIIVLVSEKTPEDYLSYLRDREYDYIICGKDKVDLRRSFGILNDKYGIKRIRTDAGGTLNSRLIEEGLADEISLLIVPTLVGKGHKGLFESLDLKEVRDLELIGRTIHPGGVVHLRYRIGR